MPITPAQEEAMQRKRAQVVQLRLAGVSWEQIGRQLDPPVTPQRAHAIWKQAMRAIPATEAEEARRQEETRLDQLITQALQILRTDHLLVQGGQVVMYQERPLHDLGPKMAALSMLVKLSESRRKLLGLDMPAKHEVRHFNVDQLDEELARVRRELDELPPPTADQLTEPNL